MTQYGLWSVVVVQTAVLVVFALSFFRPHSKNDWRAMGGFSAFLLALFAEMYGFPLTLYLLWSWVGSSFPGLNPLSHSSGHIWLSLFNYQGDPHFTVLHEVSNVLIVGGFAIIVWAWRILHRAAREGTLAQAGPYRWVRHPQYLGFIVIMLGFLVQWPTLPTVVMFPVLVAVYTRLARREEKAVLEVFGQKYKDYSQRTGAFLPSFSRKRAEREGSHVSG